jgi:hypothetical protein
MTKIWLEAFWKSLAVFSAEIAQAKTLRSSATYYLLLASVVLLGANDGCHRLGSASDARSVCTRRRAVD